MLPPDVILYCGMNINIKELNIYFGQTRTSRTYYFPTTNKRMQGKQSYRHYSWSYQTRSTWSQSSQGYPPLGENIDIYIIIPSHAAAYNSYIHEFNRTPSIPEIRLFHDLILNIQGQGHGCLKGQGYIVCPPSNRFICLLCLVYRTTHSWNTAIAKFHPTYPRLKSRLGSKVEFAKWIRHFINPYPFCSMLVRAYIPGIQ